MITDTDEEGHYAVSYSADLDNTANFEYEVTNTHTPILVTVKVDKTWVDNKNQSGKRPDSIEIVITGKVGDNVVVGTYTETITGDAVEEFWTAPGRAPGPKATPPTSTTSTTTATR